MDSSIGVIAQVKGDLKLVGLPVCEDGAALSDPGAGCEHSASLLLGIPADEGVAGRRVGDVVGISHKIPIGVAVLIRM